MTQPLVGAQDQQGSGPGIMSRELEGMGWGTGLRGSALADQAGEEVELPSLWGLRNSCLFSLESKPEHI